MVDALVSVVTYLQADPALTALVGQRVFGQELDRDEAPSMPRKAVVVKTAGSALAWERDGYANLSGYRLDIWHYGETPYEAWRTRLASCQRMKDLERRVVAGVLLHGANRVGGPLPMRDPTTDWPLLIETWELLASDVAAAAAA